jgi:hypothetical protein
VDSSNINSLQQLQDALAEGASPCRMAAASLTPSASVSSSVISLAAASESDMKILHLVKDFAFHMLSF